MLPLSESILNHNTKENCRATLNHLILLSQIGTGKNISNQILVTLHLGMYQKVALFPHKINSK